MLTTTQHLAGHAAWLHQAWPALHESRLKGTPRRWKQTDTTQHTNTQHRAEKQAAGAPAGTDSPAPLHLDILDHIITTTRTAANITHLIQTTGLNATPHSNTTQDQLNYIAQYANVLDGDDPTVIQHEKELHTVRRTIERQWGEIVINQRLKAPCPWCHQEQLKFRAIGPEDNHEMVVRCESGACEPPEADCGTWYRGPCWPFHEWQWLAGRIDHALDETSAAS